MNNLVPISTGLTTLVAKEEYLPELKEINLIHIYEPRYIVVSGPTSFEEEKKAIRLLFQRNAFNIIDYNNWKAGSVRFYVKTSDDLRWILNRMEQDVENGHFPFRYGVCSAVNIKNLRKR